LRLDQSASYRLRWADAAAGTERDVRDYLERRRLAWRCFRAASADYRRLKAMIGNGNFTLAA
jgi:hypothetical protein